MRPAHAWLPLALFQSAPALLVLLGLASTARAADADEIRAHLQVRAGATCLGVDQLVPEIEQWAYDAPIASDSAIVVEGSQTDRRSARVLVMRGGRTIAHRAFEPGPERCEHLLAAVGLSIALSLKASLLEELGQPLPDDPDAHAQGWSVAGAALLGQRVLPRLAPGLWLSARHGFAEYGLLRLGAFGLATAGAELPAGAGTFNATLSGVRADLCVRGRVSRDLHGSVCAGLWGGALYAAGADVPDPQRSVVGWVALANALELELTLADRWSLALEATLSVLLHDVNIGLEQPRGERVATRALPGVGVTVGLGPIWYF